MTAPQQPPPQEPPAAAPPVPVDEDGAPVIPIVLATLAAYLAAKQVVKGPWRNTAAVLGLAGIAGNALDRVARRGLSRQAKHVGKKAAASLWVTHERAVTAGVEAGMQHLVRTVYGVQDRMLADAVAARSDAGRDGSPAAPGGTTTARSAPKPGSADAAKLRPRDLLDGPALSNVARDLLDTVVQTAMNTAVRLAQGWTKTWHTRGDDRVRDAHRALAGVTIPVLDSFTTPEGTIRYPHDPKAPAGLVINCRCSLGFRYDPSPRGDAPVVDPDQGGYGLAAAADPGAARGGAGLGDRGGDRLVVLVPVRGGPDVDPLGSGDDRG